MHMFIQSNRDDWTQHDIEVKLDVQIDDEDLETIRYGMANRCTG